MHYDTLVIGGGLSGLTAGSLLAKKGVNVAVIDKSRQPGGTCGIFKRNHVTFDQGSAMLYGFGENGFNAHRFVFNCLEEPIDIIRHELLYCVNFKGKRIKFWPDIDRFTEELSSVFPAEKNNIKRFYHDMLRIYRHVLIEIPMYASADEISLLQGFRIILRHPVSFARFLGFLNISAERLLKKYFSDPEIFKFFDKLTSTYCYATVKEAPAVLAAIMFVDNHEGGSYYPAGSTQFLTGKLEKVIEENGGEMILEKEVVSIIFNKNRPAGVRLNDNTELFADNIIYSGTVWNLYGNLIDPVFTTKKRREWAKRQIPTYSSVVLFAVVDRNVIPEDTAPIEMLVGNPDEIDESEVTAYILSIDDSTLCAPDEHTLVVIGPTFENWKKLDPSEYSKSKKKEIERLVKVLERRVPGLKDAVRYMELASPITIEKYTMKNGGAAAGPKQMLGQHILKRLHTRTEWKNLLCCGESTVMGTGTPTVTTSGLTAANLLLKRMGKKPYVYSKDMKDYINFTEKPFTASMMYMSHSKEEKEVMRKALRCLQCEHPSCADGDKTDIPGIMRRVAVSNFKGAKMLWDNTKPVSESASVRTDAILKQYENMCIRNHQTGKPVDINSVISYLNSLQS